MKPVNETVQKHIPWFAETFNAKETFLAMWVERIAYIHTELYYIIMSSMMIVGPLLVVSLLIRWIYCAWEDIQRRSGSTTVWI